MATITSVAGGSISRPAHVITAHWIVSMGSDKSPQLTGPVDRSNRIDAGKTYNAVGRQFYSASKYIGAGSGLKREDCPVLGDCRMHNTRLVF